MWLVLFRVWFRMLLHLELPIQCFCDFFTICSEKSDCSDNANVKPCSIQPKKNLKLSIFLSSSCALFRSERQSNSRKVESKSAKSGTYMRRLLLRDTTPTGSLPQKHFDDVPPVYGHSVFYTLVCENHVRELRTFFTVVLEPNIHTFSVLSETLQDFLKSKLC